MTKTLTIPSIHLNGTSRQSLVDDICEAVNALNDAYGAIKRTAPNGRDYYPQGAEAMTRATAEHFDRLGRLDSIKEELEDLAQAIMNA